MDCIGEYSQRLKKYKLLHHKNPHNLQQTLDTELDREEFIWLSTPLYLKKSQEIQ